MANKLKIFLMFQFLFAVAYTTAEAQHRKVKSGTYNLLLKKLLSHTVPEITVDSLSKIKNSVFLLDARETEEYNVSHLYNAKFVGYKTFSIDSLVGIDKNAPIIVYCSVGYRSEKIAEQLLNAGYSNVKNLYGGIFEWKNEQHNVFDINGITNNVHPYNKTWGMWLKNGNKTYTMASPVNQ